MKYLSSDSFYATQEKNNFGDQIIVIYNNRTRETIKIEVLEEGSHIDFNEKNLKKLLKRI